MLAEKNFNSFCFFLPKISTRWFLTETVLLQQRYISENVEHKFFGSVFSQIFRFHVEHTAVDFRANKYARAFLLPLSSSLFSMSQSENLKILCLQSPSFSRAKAPPAKRSDGLWERECSRFC